ncbi:MAG: helix-turn-helix transcriptional regulator [Chitinophagaceae bacterium]|nr:helix-turn-helix transcriptional regulator [Chitinophagaceae bacterium]
MLHEKLKELRKLKGLSQEEVAKALHVQQNTYCGWETGKHQISTDKISSICELFNIQPNELFTNSITQTFNEKVQNGYIHNVENLHTEANETIAIIKQQNELNQHTLDLLRHQMDAICDLLKK